MASARSSLLLRLLFLLFLTAASAAAQAAPKENVTTGHTRKLTSSNLSDAPIGEWIPIQNVSDPYVQTIAKFAVAQNNKKSGSNLTLVAVLSGETQFIKGTKYRLRLTASDGNIYETVVYDRPSAKIRAVLYFQTLQGQILDGWIPVQNVSDPYIQDLAKFAVAQHNNASGSHLTLVNVLSGDYQLVVGVNYRLLIEASDEHVYEAVVFDQRWTQTRNLTSFTLKQNPAVWQRIPDVSKPEIQEMANFAVTEHNKAARSNLVLVAVLSGEKQVVAGINHKLLIKTSDGRVYEAVVFRRSRAPKSRKVISFKLNN